MIEEIEKGMKVLFEVIEKREGITADEALKFTQAISNLANARASIITWPVKAGGKS